MRRILALFIAVTSLGLFLYSSSSPIPNVPMVPTPSLQLASCDLPPSPSFLVLNAPLLSFQDQNGGELKMTPKVDYESFCFGADMFEQIKLSPEEKRLVNLIKGANDTNLDVAGDLHSVTLKPGQTGYYGVRILPPKRGEVTGVTFILTTVPISGVPDIVNNYFKIKYVETVGGSAGNVEDGTTSGKAYQVISPAGDIWFFFAFTAVVKSGGIRTTIEPHFFGGPHITSVEPQFIQCCCEHVKTPLIKVPEPTICWWYGIPYISDLYIWWYKYALYCKAVKNTANVPCTHGEATGKDLTIKGDGFNRLRGREADLPTLITITDDCGSVARVTEATIVSDTEIKAKIDITACRPGQKCVKIGGVGGFGTVTFLKVVQDVPDTIVTQKRFTAVRIFGTQEKIPLTFTIDDGTNITFAQDQRYDVTCVTRSSGTMATATTTGGCNNIATTTIQGTCVPGEDNMRVTGPGIDCTAPIRNAEITLVQGATICVGRTAPATVEVKFPSTYKNTVTLTAKTTSGTPSVIAVRDAEGNVLLAGDGTATIGTNVTGETWTKGLTVVGLAPGTATLTASYCDGSGIKCVTVTFTVMELLTLTAMDKANAGNIVSDATEGTEITPVLHIYEDDAGKAVVLLTVTTDPATGEVVKRVKYTVEGATSDPTAGAFDPAKPTEVTLTPTDGNRTYTITAWLDCDNDGNRDPGETTRVVEVVVETLEKLRVTDSANPGYYVEDGAPGGPDPVMYFCNRNPVKVNLSVGLLPPEAEKAKALWIVEGNTAVPPKGNFATDPEVTLTAANDGSREFTVKAGFDRNGNGTLDSGEVTRAVAVVLEKVELTLPPYVAVGATADGSLTLAGGSTAGKWLLEYDATLLKIEEANVKVVPGELHDVTLPKTISLRVTALKAGTTAVTAVFIAKGEQAGCMDQKTASLVDIDLDVDSDNNNYTDNVTYRQSPPDRSPGEDRIEDDVELSGKVMGVNDNDDDRDGLIDMADFDNLQERDFVPIILDIPAPVDLAAARINITIPAGLQIWVKPGQVSRDPRAVKGGGDWVEGGEYAGTDLSRLGFTADNRAVTLYVEGMAPSTGRGTERILIELDPRGTGDTYLKSDAVRLTVVRPDVDVDTDRDGTITDTDDMEEGTKGYVTWRGDGGNNAARPWGMAVAPTVAAMGLTAADGMYLRLEMVQAPSGGTITLFKEIAGQRVSQFEFSGGRRIWTIPLSRWNETGWNLWPGGYVGTSLEYAVPGVYRFQLRLAIDGGFSIADEVTIRVIELQTYFTMQITEVQGLYKPDNVGIGKYNAGYTSDDDKGRIYTNRIFDPSDPGKTIWTKDKQYVDLTVRIGQPDAPIPQGAVIVWSREDPDDPSNEDPLTHQEAGDTLDPNDYDASGSYLGQKDNDNSGSRDGAVEWEQVPGSVYTLSNGNETAIVNRESKVRFNVTDDAGDNFRVTARIKFVAEGLLGESDSTGIMTSWHKIDVEYVKMASAAPLTGLLDGTANNAYAKAFIEFEVGLQRNVPDIVIDGEKQMGVNEVAADKKCEEYVTKANGEFSKEGEKGWFFAAAANYYMDTSGAGAAPVLYIGTATLQADGLTFQLPPGVALSDTDKKMTGNKTASLAPSGGYRVMKTDMVFNYANEFKDGTIDYAGGIQAVIISHTQGAPGAGNGAEITYDATSDAPNGPIEVMKIVVELVRVFKPGDPTDWISFNYHEFTWDTTARTFKVWKKRYNTPLVSGAYSFSVIDHGFTAGATLDIRVDGVGALTTDGISPGPHGGLEGRVIVFTASGGDLSTLDHEFGHGLGFYHICGNWDYRSNDSTGNACAMHYTWYWMLTTATPRHPDPWLLGNDGPYFCEEHIRAMREGNLENSSKLGW